MVSKNIFSSYGALRTTVPMTIAPPLSSDGIVTATNRPQDPSAWQNEPGPGANEPEATEVVRKPLARLETVPKIRPFVR
jgi:hypothetical protein